MNKNFIYIVINVFIPFMAAYFLSELFRNINGIVGPYIENALRLTAEELGLMTSLFFIAIAGSQLIVGIYLDRYGARRTVSFLLIFGAFGAILFASGNFILMSMGRFFIGLAPFSAASFLLYLAIFVILGNFLMGALMNRFGKSACSHQRFCLLICGLYIFAQIIILTNATAFSPYLWGVFGFSVSGSIIAYAILSNVLPANMTGRAVSLLNLFATFAGFLIQYGVGYILNLWPAIKIGEYPPIAHQWAFAFVIGGQLLALLWGAYKTRNFIGRSGRI